MDNIFGDNYSLLDRLVSDFKDLDLFKFLIVEDYDTLGLAIEYINKLSKFETETVEFNRLRIKACFKTVKSEVKTLGEVCEFQNGKVLSKSNIIKGKYPVIGGGKQPFGYHNNFNTDEDTILCSKSGAYAGYISKYNNKVWMSDCFAIYPKKQLNKDYLYYFLLCIQNKIYKDQTGNAQPHYSIKEIEKIKIPIPSLEDQEKVVKIIEDIEKEESDYNMMLQSIKDMIQCIYDSIELITDNTTKQIDEDSESSESSSEEEEDNIITYKGIEFYLDGDIVYRLKNCKKGKRYGVYKNDKIVKDKKEINIKV